MVIVQSIWDLINLHDRQIGKLFLGWSRNNKHSKR